MYAVLSVINLVLLAAILISAFGVFYCSIKEKPAKRWLRAMIFALAADLLCVLIDAVSIFSVIAFIGFYSLIFSVLSFVLAVYFTSKRKIEKKREWIRIFMVFLVLFIACAALTGVFFR